MRDVYPKIEGKEITKDGTVRYKYTAFLSSNGEVLEEKNKICNNFTECIKVKFYSKILKSIKASQLKVDAINYSESLSGLATECTGVNWSVSRTGSGKRLLNCEAACLLLQNFARSVVGENFQLNCLG